MSFVLANKTSIRYYTNVKIDINFVSTHKIIVNN